MFELSHRFLPHFILLTINHPPLLPLASSVCVRVRAMQTLAQCSAVSQLKDGGFLKEGEKTGKAAKGGSLPQPCARV